MLDMAVAELMNQSGLGQLTPLLMQFMPMFKAWGLNSLTDTRYNTFRASDFLGNRSAASMVQQRFRQREFSSMYGDLAADAETAFGRRAVESVFRAMGYSRAKASVAAGGNLGRFIAGLGEWQNPMSSGVSDITSALYSRRSMLRVAPGGDRESYVSQAHSGRRIVEGLTEAYNAGEFGRMSFSDVGGIASRLIQTGALDYASNKEGGEDSRLTRVKSQIKSYSASLEKLKDVIDGDMSKILDSMDKLFGGTTVAMSMAKLEKITTSMQHAALITGVDAKTISQNAGLGYSYIASVGGTQGMGVRMGLEATYYTQGLPSDARISKDELRSGTLMALANTTRSREARNLATAYVAWRQNQRAGANTSLNAFLGTFGNKPINNDTLMESAYASIGQRFRGATQDQISAVFGSISNSEEVLDVLETEQVGAALIDNKVDALTTNRRNALKEFYRNNKAGLKGAYSTEEAFIRGVTGGDILARSDVMYRNLNQMVGGGMGATALAAGGQLFNWLGYSEQLTLGTASTRQAQEMMRKSREGRQLRQQTLYYDMLSTDVKEVLTAAKAGNGTISSLIDAMYGSDPGKGATIRELVAGVAGVDIKRLDSLDQTALDEALKTVDYIGNKRGSALVGIRKTNGVESVEQGKKADIEYTKRRLAADKAIKNIAEGTGDERDSVALKRWADLTAMADHQRVVYQYLDQETAKRLLDFRQKDDVFADTRRIYDIAKANMSDEEFKAKGAGFVGTVRSAQQRMQEARKKHGNAMVVAMNMTKEQRAKATGAEAKALNDLREIEKTISGLGVSDELKKELLSMVTGSGGSVESLLGTIITLLTTIAGKP